MQKAYEILTKELTALGSNDDATEEELDFMNINQSSL